MKLDAELAAKEMGEEDLMFGGMPGPISPFDMLFSPFG
jgi:hypothetical protein